ncbi:uncharacterized protein METZ01_LOCUS419856, partial [marine metagenome]
MDRHQEAIVILKEAIRIKLDFVLAIEEPISTNEF